MEGTPNYKEIGKYEPRFLEYLRGIEVPVEISVILGWTCCFHCCCFPIADNSVYRARLWNSSFYSTSVRITFRST